MPTIDSTENRPQGLTHAQAAQRLRESGPNVLPEPARRGWSTIVVETAREPMFLLLMVAAGMYLLLGDLREGLFLLSMVVVMLGMTLYQEGRTEHALQALRDLSAPTALVHRDGKPQRLPASQLVPQDLIELNEGDRIPADALLLVQTGLMVDESLLTGESVPVTKSQCADTPPASSPGGDGQPWIYAGTMVVQGHGLARVKATGLHSELGRIGASLHALTRPPGRLQSEIRRLATWLALVGGAMSVTLVLVLAGRGASWLEAVLAGLALSMSVLPEEFPVILTVFPALGAWRLARVQVLTRRLAAIEVLGATTVLCVDKTGTLTENRMALQLLWRQGRRFELQAGAVLPAAACEVLQYALLASRTGHADPLDAALWEAAARCPGVAAPPAGWQLEHEYPLSSARPMMARAWRHAGAGILALKGAPEALLPLCDMDDAARAAVQHDTAALAAQGLRILAVARAAVAGAQWPAAPGDCRCELMGLLALADPLRQDIPSAVAACAAAGIRIVMITGDHAETARAIARQAGLASGATVTGSEIRALTGPALAARLREVSVCARIVPQQKLDMVQALQQGGEIVAMTGDGVNDAPALRKANVGVAMGLRGTDVAREAAELTLLDDRFASLVQAIAAGRRIFSNMRKSMTYVAAIHVPIAGMALLPPLLGWPVLLYPPHIVFLELVIDPACSLAFENEPAEPDLMRRPPRAPDEPLFGRAALTAGLLQGALTLALLTPGYGLALLWMSEAQARAAAFAALVLCNIALLLVNRRPARLTALVQADNRVFWYIVGAAVVLLGLTLYVPAVAQLFRFASPPPAAMLAAVLWAILALLSLGALRRWRG